jgi:hypothetical protein
MRLMLVGQRCRRDQFGIHIPFSISVVEPLPPSPDDIQSQDIEDQAYAIFWRILAEFSLQILQTSEHWGELHR